jgi:hypothetical protein
MEFAIGVALALAVAVFATATGLDRDRAFYPTVLIVVASYYVLFAVMGASGQIVMVETLVAGVFVLVAAVGFKMSLWLVAAALAGHGVFDLVHPLTIENPGVPLWWPGFCMAYDVAAGGILAVLLTRRSRLSSSGG